MADMTFSMTAATATPITRDDLLARLRVELHDEDAANYRWVDATLERHIDRAVRELSQVWPRERLSTLTATASSRDLGRRRRSMTWCAWRRWSGRLASTHRSTCSGRSTRTTLTLQVEAAPTDVEDVKVFWGSLHLCDASQCTLPTVAEDAVVTGASGYAALEYANFAINRANIAGTTAVEQARIYGAAQLQRFQLLLGEFGKRARVRVSGLFTPGGESGRDVVRWEP